MRTVAADPGAALPRQKPAPTVTLEALRFPPPLTLYIHLPWCVRKCPYCDFNSHALSGGLPEEAYLAALLQDLESALPLVAERPVEAVFFGGGTPSLFSPEAIDRLLGRVASLLPLAAGAEITLEANPGTFEQARFQGYRAAGVNRLSLGVQSFNARHLAALGRIHDDTEARRAVEAAVRLFDRVNVDLMYGLPGQSRAQARADVAVALACGVGHLSAYHLTIETNTRFHAQPPELPDEETVARMEEEIEALLAGCGFLHYEVSAFARPHQQCRHNLNYWLFGDYLGIGAGAHSKLTTEAGILRLMRHKQPKAYMAAAREGKAVQESHRVPAEALPLEFMMNALRLAAGFPEALFTQRTGLPLTVMEPALATAQARGLIERKAGHIRATPLGRRFLNDTLALF
jgi:oxygen-independent coproporphyrinogen-3 oxidase